VCLPATKHDDTNQGRWFLSSRGVRSAKFSLAAGVLFTVLFIGLSELLPDPEVLLPAVPPLITTGLVPFLVLALSMWLFIKIIRERLTLFRAELIQSVIVLMITSYTILTLAGIFFRGEGMNLVWPWQV